MLREENGTSLLRNLLDYELSHPSIQKVSTEILETVYSQS